MERVRLWVRFSSSNASMMPRIVTMIAAIFVIIGMVIGGVFVGRMLDVIRRPAITLPNASRVMGLVTAGEFSLIGVIEGIRVNPVCTMSIIRMLYVAVKEVASKVSRRAQVFR